MEFIKSISKAGLMSGTFMSTLDKLMASNELRSANDLSTDEDFWAKVREGYRLKPDYINLENGYYCIMPQEIMDRHIQREREVNFQGSWYMRNHRLKDNIEIRKKLAQVVGAKTEEVILTRNATESLDTIIAAYDWRPGDEAVMAIQDYGSMLDMFRLQARRYGLVNKKVDLVAKVRDPKDVLNEIYANLQSAAYGQSYDQYHRPNTAYPEDLCDGPYTRSRCTRRRSSLCRPF